MTAEWRDRDNESEILIGQLRIIVHQYVGCGDTLFWTCRELGLYQQQLKSKLMRQAKRMALRMVRRKLERRIQEHRACIDELTELLER